LSAEEGMKALLVGCSMDGGDVGNGAVERGLEGELWLVIGFGGVEELDVVGGCVLYNLICHGIGLENVLS
jgi:hypothetical protein